MVTGEANQVPIKESSTSSSSPKSDHPGFFLRQQGQEEEKQVTGQLDHQAINKSGGTAMRRIQPLVEC